MTPLKLISCVLRCNFSVPLPHQCSCRVLPRITFGKGAFGILPTIPVRIPCGVNSLEAYPRGRLGSCTQRTNKQNEVRGFLYESEDDVHTPTYQRALIYPVPTGWCIVARESGRCRCSSSLRHCGRRAHHADKRWLGSGGWHQYKTLAGHRSYWTLDTGCQPVSAVSTYSTVLWDIESATFAV